MLIHVAIVHVMQMAVVEIVNVVAMTHGSVPAAWTVDVGVVRVLGI